MFTQQNTDGYTDNQIDDLNSEFNDIIESENIEIDSDDYYRIAQSFSDHVAQR